MKKYCLVLVPLFILGLFFVGCDSSTTNNQDVPNNRFQETGTIQGTVYDATTGEAIGDESLEITLIMGTNYKSPNLLKKDPTKPFLGDFAFTGVPVTLQDNAEYRIVATMNGYEKFEGYIGACADIWTSCCAQNVPTQDTVYNYIGNIYLFPLGSTAPDYTFYLEYDDERVPNATVYFEYNPAEGDAVTHVSHNRIPSEKALGQTLIGTTDANGMVTFAGDNLVLGGEYRLTVLPVVYEGVQLRKWSSHTFYVGETENEYLVTLTDLVPGYDDDGLKIIMESNLDEDSVTASGVVTLSFNQVVNLVDEKDCAAFLTGGTGVLDATDLPDSGLTVTGSGTSTLTFTPVFSTQPGATDSDVYINFGSCLITVGDDVNDPRDVWDVPYVDGSTGTVPEWVQLIP